MTFSLTNIPGCRGQRLCRPETQAQEGQGGGQGQGEGDRLGLFYTLGARKHPCSIFGYIRWLRRPSGTHLGDVIWAAKTRLPRRRSETQNPSTSSNTVLCKLLHPSHCCILPLLYTVQREVSRLHCTHSSTPHQHCPTFSPCMSSDGLRGNECASFWIDRQSARMLPPVCPPMRISSPCFDPVVAFLYKSIVLMVFMLQSHH